MGWADHEPSGGFDAPTESGAGEILPKLNAKSIFAAGVAAERQRAKKQAKREAMEFDRLARLARLKKATASTTRTSSRWIMGSPGRWTWFEYSAESGSLVDTGIEPVAGVPLPQQRPEGR
jgi:hypothetical protein